MAHSPVAGGEGGVPGSSSSISRVLDISSKQVRSTEAHYQLS